MQNRRTEWMPVIAMLVVLLALPAFAAEPDATQIILADGATVIDGDGAMAQGDVVTITAAGTYHLSGALSEGQVRIEAGRNDDVTLVLEGVSIASSTGVLLYEEDAQSLRIMLADGSANALVDMAEVKSEDEDPDAALFATHDLVIEGDGSLNITSANRSGIAAKDNITVGGGVITVDAAEDTFNASDNLTITGGDLTLAAGDDAIHADEALLITGGTINISQCEEGIEGLNVDIRGGDISLISADDGINAAGGDEGSPDMWIHISGGTLVINAQGDGFDSNGSLLISGGVITIHGPTGSDNGSLDADGDITVTGGVIAAAGSSGMEGVSGEGSTQPSVAIYYDTIMPEGTHVVLENAEGEAIISYTAEKSIQTVLFSAPDLVDGDTVTIVTNGEMRTPVTVPGIMSAVNTQGETVTFGGRPSETPRP